MNAYEEYMKQITQPMRDELTTAGFTELTTPEQVESFVTNAKGKSLVVINSVCGCAAGLARPAVIEALKQEGKLDNLVTVFAGQDREATDKMREYFVGIEPSSPSIALMENDEVIHFIPREEIEGHELEDISTNLTSAFQRHNI
ncbi:UPF0403 protein YphP [Paraliobacillus quinghaiensis]|uniref:UPF0403 protein YphP n=1 Tax=Paraliobacillus quinghaiensis TaxID=470815 RepID=A0A917TTW2_9BACI|nr:BrxA/BrxB family bacilliredoxin [Paraliobacillus quinghaiensis]GGM35978.1 UPF0403 protein YphP [Paraliobacillus quinghaiensis]